MINGNACFFVFLYGTHHGNRLLQALLSEWAGCGVSDRNPDNDVYD